MAHSTSQDEASFDAPDVCSVQDLVKSAVLAAERLTLPQIWWRGTPDETFSLVPSVYREGRDYGDEQRLAADFWARAPARQAGCPDRNDLSAWLFLMQHYGLPTRLLDWTESILVAAYFAVESRDDSGGVLWALDPYRLNQAEVGQLTILGPEHPSVVELCAQPFHGITSDGPTDCVAAIMARHVDMRMVVQHSAFTIHGTPTPLDGRQQLRGCLMKFRIPASRKRVVRAQLFALGVRRELLFPDLDTLSRELRMRRGVSLELLSALQDEQSP